MLEFQALLIVLHISSCNFGLCKMFWEVYSFFYKNTVFFI